MRYQSSWEALDNDIQILISFRRSSNPMELCERESVRPFKGSVIWEANRVENNLYFTWLTRGRYPCPKSPISQLTRVLGLAVDSEVVKCTALYEYWPARSTYKVPTVRKIPLPDIYQALTSMRSCYILTCNGYPILCYFMQVSWLVPSQHLMDEYIHVWNEKADNQQQCGQEGFKYHTYRYIIGYWEHIEIKYPPREKMLLPQCPYIYIADNISWPLSKCECTERCM